MTQSEGRPEDAAVEPRVAVPAGFVRAIPWFVLGGLTVSASAVALMVSLLVRHYGGGIGARSAGAVADLALVAAFAGVARRCVAVPSASARTGETGTGGPAFVRDVANSAAHGDAAPGGAPPRRAGAVARVATVVLALVAAATLAYA